MDDTELAAFLGAARTIAVLGASDKPGRPVDRVGRYLIRAGYQVIPVHPVRKSVWDIPAWPCLAAVPHPVDIVNLFRAAEYCAGHARETLALPCPPLLFWMQSGIVSEEAMNLMRGRGIAAVQDACIMVEHARLFPDPSRHAEKHL